MALSILGSSNTSLLSCIYIRNLEWSTTGTNEEIAAFILIPVQLNCSEKFDIITCKSDWSMVIQVSEVGFGEFECTL